MRRDIIVHDNPHTLPTQPERAYHKGRAEELELRIVDWQTYAENLEAKVEQVEQERDAVIARCARTRERRGLLIGFAVACLIALILGQVILRKDILNATSPCNNNRTVAAAAR